MKKILFILIWLLVILWAMIFLFGVKKTGPMVEPTIDCNINRIILDRNESFKMLSYLGNEKPIDSTIWLRYSVGIKNATPYTLKNFWISAVVPNYMIPFVVHVTDTGITMDISGNNKSLPLSYEYLFLQKEQRFENPDILDGVLFLAQWNDQNGKKVYKVCEVSK